MKKSKKNLKFKRALIKLKPSKIQKDAVGVFAVRNLKKGTMVGDVKFLNENVFMTWAAYEKVDRDTRKVMKNFCVTGVNGVYAPVDINYLSIPWFFNHCCDGNVGYDPNGNFITIKNIKKDSELCYDYGLAGSFDPNFEFNCSCGGKNCRKIITGHEWMDARYNKKNYKYMTPELKKIVDKRKK